MMKYNVIFFALSAVFCIAGFVFMIYHVFPGGDETEFSFYACIASFVLALLSLFIREYFIRRDRKK